MIMSKTSFALSVLLSIAGTSIYAGTTGIDATNTTLNATARESKFVGARAESQYQGKAYITELRWSDIVDTPRWNADVKPPLSIEKAEFFARHCLQQKAGLPPLPVLVPFGLESWRLSEIAIRRWFRMNIWFYEIKMVPYPNYPPVTVFVTMDGNAVAPKPKH